MDVERLKCKQCGKFPDGEIFECASKEHIICVTCIEKSRKFLCACGARLIDEKQRNPIEQLIQHATIRCRYEENGCTWKFTSCDMETHVLECKYRPYRCIVSTLNVLSCDWIGLQYEIEDHLVECHKELGPVFRFRQCSSMVFKEHVSLGGLKIVDAFSKHFLFHFFSDAAKQTVYFLMIYFGRRAESNQYCFDLELRSLPWLDQVTPDADKAGLASDQTTGLVRSVKFVERCYSDSENILDILEEQRCISLTHRYVQNYLHNGKIFFSYRVRKVDGSCGVAGRESELPESDPTAGKASAAKTKPRPPPFVFAEKGKVSANTKRSASSNAINSSASSGSTVKSPSSSSVEGGTSGKDTTTSTSVVSRSPSSVSTLTISSEKNTADGSAGSFELGYSHMTSTLSSINRVTGHHSPFEKPEHSPLMTPSINRIDMPPSWAVSQAATSSVSYQQYTEYRSMNGQVLQPGKRYPPAERTTTAAVCKEYTQPYKVQDTRPYLLKHPTNCLYKPQPKW